MKNIPEDGMLLHRIIIALTMKGNFPQMDIHIYS